MLTRTHDGHKPNYMADIYAKAFCIYVALPVYYIYLIGIRIDPPASSLLSYQRYTDTCVKSLTGYTRTHSDSSVSASR